MARRFFIEKVPNRNNSLLHIIIIAACIIGVILCFFFVSRIVNNSHKNAVFEFRNPTTVLINTKITDKTIFFKELQHVKEKDIIVNYDNVDFSKVGVYDVIITLYNKNYNIQVEVVDNESPTLTLKTLNVESGYEYKAEDFVEKCSDNSNEECKYKFYDLATDQDGNQIDYSKYINDGEYTVQIVAFDASNNESAPISTTLVIGKPSENGSILCKYGKNDYNSDEYILATYITHNDCALNLDLYNDENTIIPANKIMEEETDKLKKEFQSLNINEALTLNRLAKAVINNEGTGIVGYTVHMELLIGDRVIESYYVNLEGQRVYSVNEYNLK